jgi:hypothetical protein
MTRQEIFKEGIKIVSEITGVSKDNMLRGGRYRVYVNARKTLIYFLREKYQLGWTVIGNLVDMNHASAIYAYRYVVKNHEFDVEIGIYKAQVDALEITDNMKMRKTLISIMKKTNVSVDTRLDKLIEILSDEKGDISQHYPLPVENYTIPKGSGKTVKQVEGV